MKNVALGGNLQARLRGMILMSMSNKFGVDGAFYGQQV